MKSCREGRNMPWCTCTYEPCEKKGICCECLHGHLQAGELPACAFPEDIEKTFDRSIERFVKIYKDRL